MNYLAIVIGLALTVGLVGVAPAESTIPSESQQARFAAWDKNADGYLSPAEAAKVDGLSHAFARVDANQDGKVDAVEYATFEELGEE